jgi:hypothetical protein
MSLLEISPNLLTIGREIRLPADLVFGHVNETESEVHNLWDYVLNIKNKTLQAHEVAKRYLLEQIPKGTKKFMMPRCHSLDMKKAM